MEQRSISIENIALTLEQGIPEIDFAFIFGSSSGGKVNITSDIDVAVYFNTEVTLDLILKVVRKVEETTQTRCDLSILNTASEILRFEALKGRLLFVRQNKINEYAAFYSLTCREYEDKFIWMKKQMVLRGYA